MPGIIATQAVNVRALQLAALEALKATGEPLETPTLILYQNNHSPSKETVIGDLTECNFTGYAAVAAVAFGAAHIDTDGKVKMKAPSETFVASGAAVGNSVFGWAITNAAKTALYVAQAFDTEYVISETGQGITVQPEVVFPDND